MNRITDLLRIAPQSGCATISAEIADHQGSGRPSQSEALTRS
jgi:hypothetical protein